MSTQEIALAGETAVAPTAHWHVSEPTGHAVQFYADDSFLIDSVSRFIGTALGAGDAAIVVATKPHRIQLAQRLTARGFDPLPATRAGRYVVLDARETLAKFMRDGHPDAAAFKELAGNLISAAHAAAESKPSRVVIFGEAVAVLWADGNPDAALALQHLLNELAKSHPIAIHCA